MTGRNFRICVCISDVCVIKFIYPDLRLTEMKLPGKEWQGGDVDWIIKFDLY